MTPTANPTPTADEERAQAIQAAQAEAERIERALMSFDAALIAQQSQLRRYLAEKKDHEVRILALRNKINDDNRIISEAKPVEAVQKETDDKEMFVESLTKELGSVQEQYGATYSNLMSMQARLAALQSDVAEKSAQFRQANPRNPEAYSDLANDFRVAQGNLSRFTMDYNMIQQRFDKLAGDRDNLEITLKRNKQELRRLEQELVVAKRMEVVRIEKEKLERDEQLLQAEHQELLRQLHRTEQETKLLTDNQRRTAIDLEQAKAALWRIQSPEEEKKKAKK